MSAAAESVQVENVVASSDIGQELDLKTLAGDLEATDYNPDTFPGVVYWMHEPKAAALIFNSVKVVYTGAKSVDNVKTALEHFFDELRDLGVASLSYQRSRFRTSSQVRISGIPSI